MERRRKFLLVLRTCQVRSETPREELLLGGKAQFRTKILERLSIPTTVLGLDLSDADRYIPDLYHLLTSRLPPGGRAPAAVQPLLDLFRRSPDTFYGSRL